MQSENRLSTINGHIEIISDIKSLHAQFMFLCHPFSAINRGSLAGNKGLKGRNGPEVKLQARTLKPDSECL